MGFWNFGVEAEVQFGSFETRMSCNHDMSDRWVIMCPSPEQVGTPWGVPGVWHR